MGVGLGPLVGQLRCVKVHRIRDPPDFCPTVYCAVFYAWQIQISPLDWNSKIASHGCESISPISFSTSPLPYFALSNLLTLFSHDIPTLPLAQHVFDYLLARPPIFSIYLAASVS